MHEPPRPPRPEELKGQTGVCTCGAWWTGYNRSHCAACHETFSGVTAFDAHHRNGHKHPSKVAGLIAIPRSYGRMWGPPHEADDRAA